MFGSQLLFSSVSLLPFLSFNRSGRTFASTPMIFVRDLVSEKKQHIFSCRSGEPDQRVHGNFPTAVPRLRVPFGRKCHRTIPCEVFPERLVSVLWHRDVFMICRSRQNFKQTSQRADASTRKFVEKAFSNRL